MILDSREKVEFYRTKMQDLVSCFYLILFCFWLFDGSIDTMNFDRLGTIGNLSLLDGIMRTKIPYIVHINKKKNLLMMLETLLCIFSNAKTALKWFVMS